MDGGRLSAGRTHNGEKCLVPFNNRIRRIRHVSGGLNIFIGQRYWDLGLQAATEYCEGQESRCLSHVSSIFLSCFDLRVSPYGSVRRSVWVLQRNALKRGGVSLIE